MITAQTIRFDIYMAGDIAQAKQVCREHCFDVGLCVHIEPVDFIYTGGEEAGFKIGLINYPRFPSDHESLNAAAQALAQRLMEHLCQHSFCIIGPSQTEWFSRRPDPLALPHAPILSHPSPADESHISRQSESSPLSHMSTGGSQE